MKGKILGAVIFIIAAIIPWVYLSNEYGLDNIPHYTLTMWIFMELYILLCICVLAAVVLILSSGDEEAPPSVKQIIEEEKIIQEKAEKISEQLPPQNQEPEIPEESERAEDFPEIIQHEDGSYELPPVEYPESWDQEDWD